jgi:hypothetical protein
VRLGRRDTLDNENLGLIIEV